MLGHYISFAFRQIRLHPTYALTAVLSMALGIGAAAAVYSVLFGVLIDPYPYRDADRIAFITVHWENQAQAGQRGLTLHQIQQLRRLPPIEDAIAQRSLAMLETSGNLPVTVNVREATSNELEFLGDPPFLGRIFTGLDAPEGKDPPPVAVISYLFWKAHFLGRSDILGRTIELDRHRYTVIGVMGPRFTWGDGEVYLPMPPPAADERFQVLVRIRPGITLQSASQQIEPFIQQDNREHPKMFGTTKSRTEIQSLNDFLLGKFKGILFLLFASVAVLLLIGCGNVSILMLARGTARTQELAMRTAMGAPRSSLLQQLLVEALAISVTGGLLGVGLAFFGIQLIKSLMPEYAIPHEVVIAINFPVLLFSTGVSVLCGVVFGISPALRFSRPELVSLMQSGATRSTTMRKMPAHAILLGGQIALTVLLLASASAAMRNFLQAAEARLGFNPEHVLSADVPLPRGEYATWETRAQYLDSLLEKFRGTTGVKAAAFVSGFFPVGNWMQTVDIPGRPADAGRRAGVSLVSADLFRALEIPLQSGRLFTRTEVLRGARVAVVSQMLANRFFGGTAALGSRIDPKELSGEWPGLVRAPGSGPVEIVGIVADIRNDGLHRPSQPQIYVPFTLIIPTEQGLFVRTDGDPNRLTHTIASAVLKLNGRQTLEQPMPYPEFLSKFVLSHDRFTSILFSLFSVVALGLAAVGLFSVIAYTVEQRTREIGLRLALGAQRRNILSTLLASTVRTAAIGLLSGIALTLLLSNTVYRWTESSTREPVVLFAVAVTLMIASVVACWLPAHRAISIEPMQALRTE